MTRSPVLTRVLDGLAALCLAVVLLFPGVVALVTLLGGAGPSGGGPSASGAAGFLGCLLTRSDSGAQTEFSAGFLREMTFLAGVFWLLRPRSLPRPVRGLLFAGGAFLGLVLLSAATSTQVRDALTTWVDARPLLVQQFMSPLHTGLWQPLMLFSGLITLMVLMMYFFGMFWRLVIVFCMIMCFRRAAP